MPPQAKEEFIRNSIEGILADCTGEIYGPAKVAALIPLLVEADCSEAAERVFAEFSKENPGHPLIAPMREVLQE